MSKTNWRAGEEIILDFGPVTRTVAGVVTPISLRTNGVKMRFIAKRDKADADGDAEINLDYNFTAGVANQNGVYVNDTAEDNTGFVLATEGLTGDITQPLYLQWELWLEEPGGRSSVVEYGELSISPSVLHGSV